jgi:hypothetical protein
MTRTCRRQPLGRHLLVPGTSHRRLRHNKCLHSKEVKEALKNSPLVSHTTL